MKVKVKLKNLRISPRKVRVSADMIRGCMVNEAIFRLENTTKKSNEPLKKLLESARANAVNNFNLNETSLRVAEILVGEGATLKRWRPRAYGRASQILKRSSHIYLTLEESGDNDNNKLGKDKAIKKEYIKESKKTINDKTEGSEKIIKRVKKKERKILKGNEKNHRKVDIKRKENPKKA